MLYLSRYLGLAAILVCLFSCIDDTIEGEWKLNEESLVTTKKGNFPLIKQEEIIPIIVSANDHAGVKRVAEIFARDIEMVGGLLPPIVGQNPMSKYAVIIGTIGESDILDKLIIAGKLDTAGLTGKWEMSVIDVVRKPLEGIEQALVIAGSDKRGTIYGMFEVSEQIGVSPWYWWADVPVMSKPEVFIKADRIVIDEPAVKYRGIFINDEAPALSGWVEENFGSFNHDFYEHVFELILRLKGNYLWPAMWGRAMYDDDPQTPVIADEYGVVIGTSHHEPLMRAHVEWERYGKGPWDYSRNEKRLREFWKEGIERMGSNESIVTIGMRGDGDEPMSEESNIALLERIVADQRGIISEVTGKDASATPQLWALYKEVQEYYDKGMRVPDDVTLLLCDDNWGNIRKLPKPGGPPRKGGYGIYYHFDYVGGPRNYKWLNTNPLPRVWEQMSLAYDHGVDKIWIVNVGDIKPMELPISFFLDLAWDPAAITHHDIFAYTKAWAGQQFGEEHSQEIAEILDLYTKYNGRRKPELLNLPTYSLVNFNEADRIVEDWYRLQVRTRALATQIPDTYQDAYYQLVQYPVEACANVNSLNVAWHKNALYASQGRASTNAMADTVKAAFKRDSIYTYHYNRIMSGGKWNHFMDQIHIGYTYWQQPSERLMPDVTRLELPETAIMGVSVEGSRLSWPGSDSVAKLPQMDLYGPPERSITIFNRGDQPFKFEANSPDPWLTITPGSGEVELESTVRIGVNWSAIPDETYEGSILIKGPGGQEVKVFVPVEKHEYSDVLGFVENGGFISIEAEHFTRAVSPAPYEWLVIPGMGRTLSAVTAYPAHQGVARPGGTSPHLEYPIYLTTADSILVHAYLSPTLNIYNNDGLRYAVSIDDKRPVIVNMHSEEEGERSIWNKWVADNINIKTSKHFVAQPGNHVLKFWLVDPAVVLQKIVIETGNLPPSYLGPPESVFLNQQVSGS